MAEATEWWAATAADRRDLARRLWALVPEEVRPAHWLWDAAWPWASSVAAVTRTGDGLPSYLWRQYLPDPRLLLWLVVADGAVDEHLAPSLASILPARERAALEALDNAVGVETTDLYRAYLGARRSHADPMVYWTAYDRFLRALPMTAAVLADRLASAAESGNIELFESVGAEVFAHSECPDWLIGAYAFGVQIGNERVRSSEATVERAILSAGSPLEAFNRLLEVYPTDSDLKVDLDSLGNTWIKEMHWDALDIPYVDPDWPAFWDPDVGEPGAFEYPAFVTATAVCAWLGERETLPPGALSLYVASLRLLFDLAVQRGLAPLARNVAGELASALLAHDELVRSDLTETVPATITAPVTALYEMHGALSVLAVPRDRLRVDVAGAVAALIAALPGDVLLGGTSSPESIVARMTQNHAEVIAQLSGADKEAAQRVGRTKLDAVAPGSLMLPFFNRRSFIEAFGLPLDSEEAIERAAAERARQVEALLNELLADAPRDQGRVGLRRFVAALDASAPPASVLQSWPDRPRRAQVKRLVEQLHVARNDLQHRHLSRPLRQGDLSFLVPEAVTAEQPGGRRENIMLLVQELAEAARRVGYA